MSDDLSNMLGANKFYNREEGSLHHGGRVNQAAQRFGIARDDWLDLSTGVNPNGWPIVDIPRSQWARLPEQDDGLEKAAANYYEADHVVPVAGSQAAIQLLPTLRRRSHIATLEFAYAEHAHCWQRAGHSVTAVSPQQIDAVVDNVDVLVLVHPNNPTGETFKVDELLHWHNKLAAKGGWLIVDEAFMDATPEFSLGAYSSREGLIVLRSLGKFFGLAGARVGFVFANPDLLNSLQAQIGPWTVNGPARWIATHALQDRRWQVATRSQLNEQGLRLDELLCSHGLVPDGGCALFKWVKTASAISIYETLAKQGVLCRLFEKPSSLRFGLPSNESEWQRFNTALSGLS